MPQPLEFAEIHFQIDLLADYPEHAMGIGLVAYQWARLERNLLTAFTAFMLSGKPLSWGAAVTEEAWYSMENLKVRLDLLANIIRRRAVSPSLVAEFRGKIAPSIRKRAAERHRIVHGVWGCSPAHHGNLVLCMENPFRNLLYTPADFKEVAQRIVETSQATAAFLKRAQAAAPDPSWPGMSISVSLAPQPPPPRD